MLFRKNEDGQVLVEAALVMPLMIFFTLGIMQMTMMQQAKIMTDYSAYAAARSGVVYNADPEIMTASANIAILPTRARTNSLKSLAVAYLKYSLANFLKTELEKITGGQSTSPVAHLLQGALMGFLQDILGIKLSALANVFVVNPLFDDFTDISGATSVPEADDFDVLNPAVNNKKKNILTVAVSYNYELTIPFANWIIFEIWSASQVGLELTGAIWSARVKNGGVIGFIQGGSNATGGTSTTNSRMVSRAQIALEVVKNRTYQRTSQKIRLPLAQLYGLANRSVYIIPLYSSYSMRMHSNVYKKNLSPKIQDLLR